MGSGKSAGSLEGFEVRFKPWAPALKSLLTLLLLKGLGVESSQFLSNLDGSQVPL